MREDSPEISMESHLESLRNRKENAPLISLVGGSDSEEGLVTYQTLSTDTLSESEAHKPLISGAQGRFLLLLVAFLYGSLNVSLRWIYNQPGPPSASALSTARGWLATACFIPLVLPSQTTTRTTPPPSAETSAAPAASLWRVASELALFGFGAQGLLSLGLLSTASARASFFTQTSVVLTPILSALAGHDIHGRVWLGCLTAMAGLMLLSAQATGFSLSFGVGDLFCLSGAFCWSLYLFRLSQVGAAYDEIQMQAAKTFIMGLFYTTWYVVAQYYSDEILWEGWRDGITWALLFYSALGPGTLADIIQQKGQSTVSASEANVILSLEPVFTALLGLLLLRESMTIREILGGGLIVAASIIATQA